MTTGMNSVVIAVVVTIVVIGTFVLSIWMSKTNQIQENNNPKNPRKSRAYMDKVSLSSGDYADDAVGNGDAKAVKDMLALGMS